MAHRIITAYGMSAWSPTAYPAPINWFANVSGQQESLRIQACSTFDGNTTLCDGHKIGGAYQTDVTHT